MSTDSIELGSIRLASLHLPCRGSLFQLLYAPDTLSPLSPSLILKVAKDIAGGMRYLHEQAVIHRDLKTQNILITEEYGAKVADFGIVSEMEKGR